MELLTKEIAEKMPKLYANEDKKPEDVKVPLKLFDPCGRYTFYATEFDGEDTLFGYCVSPLGEDCDELGYASLQELRETKNSFGLGIERDKFWKPTTLAEVMDGSKR